MVTDVSAAKLPKTMQRAVICRRTAVLQSQSSFFTLCFVLVCHCLAAAEIEERSVTNHNVRITFSVPKEWPKVGQHPLPDGALFYTMGPANTNFSIYLYLNHSGTNKIDLLRDGNLEQYLTANLSAITKQSVEGIVRPVRFGPGKDGVYAYLTDRSLRPSSFPYFAKGVRLVGSNVVEFSLLWKDKTSGALSTTLDVIGSVKAEAASP